MSEITSVEVYILFKVGEIAKRMKLYASDADAHLGFNQDTGESVLYFDSFPSDPIKLKQFKKLCEVLGCDKNNALVTLDTWEMEDRVEAALHKLSKGHSR